MEYDLMQQDVDLAIQFKNLLQTIHDSQKDIDRRIRNTIMTA